MASGASLQAKIAKVLARVNATAKPVSLRTITVVGGNALLGVGQTSLTDDVAVDPQPVVELYASSDVADSGGILQMGDFRILFSGTVDEDTLRASQIVYGDQVLQIIKYVPAVLNSVVIVWEVTARAVTE